MSYHPSVGELRQNLEEIRKQHRLKRLRKFLKFFLVGFLIGRDSEKRISELAAKNKLILDSLIKRFIGLEHEEQEMRARQPAGESKAHLKPRLLSALFLQLLNSVVSMRAGGYLTYVNYLRGDAENN